MYTSRLYSAEERCRCMLCQYISARSISTKITMVQGCGTEALGVFGDGCLAFTITTEVSQCLPQQSLHAVLRCHSHVPSPQCSLDLSHSLLQQGRMYSACSISTRACARSTELLGHVSIVIIMSRQLLLQRQSRFIHVPCNSARRSSSAAQ